MWYNYLLIRYKVFVVELGRPVMNELRRWDICCKHYLLLQDNVAVGTARLYYTSTAVELGRMAILQNYRNKGYASLAINHLISHLKQQGKAGFIRLFTRYHNIEFYQKFGFLETETRFFDGEHYPYRTMILYL